MNAEPVPDSDFILADIIAPHLQRPTAGALVKKITEYLNDGTLIEELDWHIATGAVDQPPAGRLYGWYRVLTECDRPIAVDDPAWSPPDRPGHQDALGAITVATMSHEMHRRTFRERAEPPARQRKCETCVVAKKEREAAITEPLMPVPRDVWMRSLRPFERGRLWHLSSGELDQPHPEHGWYRLIPRCDVRRSLIAWCRKPVSDREPRRPETSETRPASSLCPKCAEIADGKRKGAH